MMPIFSLFAYNCRLFSFQFLLQILMVLSKILKIACVIQLGMTIETVASER